MTDPILADALRDLLEDLEIVGTAHEELYDTDVREQMSEAVHRSFLRPEPSYVLPSDYGMFDEASNNAVRTALLRYVQRATARAAEIGLTEPNDRLAAFQDGDIKSRGEEQYPDDFFGWAESI